MTFFKKYKDGYYYNKYAYYKYYYNKYAYYTNLFHKYTSLKTFLENIFNNTESIEKYHTSEIIKFNGIDFGVSKKEIKKKFGKPVFKWNNRRIVNHSLFVYKMYIGNYKTNVEFHFYNKVFFAGKYVFSNALSEGDRKKIEKIIFEKYKVNKAELIQDKLMIVNKQLNSIIIQNEINYTLTYLTGDTFLIDNIHRQIKNINYRIEKIKKHIDSDLKRKL